MSIAKIYIHEEKFPSHAVQYPFLIIAGHRQTAQQSERILILLVYHIHDNIPV